VSISDRPAIDPYRPPSDSLNEQADLPRKYSGYASIFARTAAFLLDYLVLVGLYVLVSWLISEMGSRSAMSEEAKAGLSAVACLLVAAIYYAALEGSAAQATLGKMAVGIQVADVHGRPIGFARALARFLAKLLSLLVLGVGFLMVVFNDRHRALHDVLTGTVVVKVR
jgi:uncharacterized RDD family membrane protein YckC